MRLGIVTVTVGYWSGVQRLVESFYKFSDFENEFFIIPNLEKERSLSAAWNLGISQAVEEGCEYIVIANDDSYLADEDVMPTVLRHMWDNDLWICRTYNAPSKAHNLGFHFFVLHPTILDKVGYFDESFWPAYYEDDDYHYRCKLIDPSKTDKVLVNVPHEESITLKSMVGEEKSEMLDLIETNAARYSDKWGGPPGFETYRVPYEGMKESGYIGLSYEPDIVELDSTTVE